MRKYTSYSLLEHNTFGINARCARFWEYNSVDELAQLIEALKDLPGTQVLHIGSGSNLLFTRDFDGTIIHSAIRGISADPVGSDTVLVRVGAGELWDSFVAHCVSQNWYGLENLSLIPGEVGASAVQNIGAYGCEVGDYIESVEAMDLVTGHIRVFSREACRYAYRNSIFKEELKGQYAITYVTYRLSTTFVPNIGYGGLAREVAERHLDLSRISAAELRQIVIDIRRQKLPDPSELGSAGSFFINPVISIERFREIQAQHPEAPHYAVAGGVKVPAGWLIEQCGWKGKRVGEVGVYAKQALVLVNYGNATGEDIVKLSDDIRRDVKRTFDIEIRPEVNFI